MKQGSRPGGGTSLAAIAFAMAAWYGCSFVTLFLNKSLLTRMKVPVHYLGLGQMCTTCFLGAVKVYGLGMVKKRGPAAKSSPDAKTESKKL